jgi:ketosteroid isomerase-like protein
VRPNAATAAASRFDAAIAARDGAALADVLAEALAVVDHANGADYGRDGVLTSFQRLLRMDDPTMHHEPLATLGESLALFRRRIGGRGGRLDVGAYERDEVCVYEVDADGRFRHVETFAAERLRAAVVRLYERYAERLPDGPARTLGSSVARSLATYDGALDADRIASGLAPSFVCVDHRTLSTWSAQGREEWRRHWRAQAELAANFALRDDDVLALDPRASAFRQTFAGISRASGGLFENMVITVITYDADGLVSRTEVFEPDQEAAALARFDALTGGIAPKPPVRRRVRPPRALRANAASANCVALEAAFARRDFAAVDALLGDPLETIEHPTGTTYGREGQLESTRWMLRLPDLVFRVEPLATLGDSLCLARRFVAASGNTAGSRFEVGAYEIESIVVNAVDAAGRITSSEVFASDHLCQAIARLYALYAESLPDGAERARRGDRVLARSLGCDDRCRSRHERLCAVLRLRRSPESRNLVGKGVGRVVETVARPDRARRRLLPARP